VARVRRDAGRSWASWRRTTASRGEAAGTKNQAKKAAPAGAEKTNAKPKPAWSKRPNRRRKKTATIKRGKVNGGHNDREKPGTRSTKIGKVVSTKMSNTIVVQVIMKKAHPLYRRVVAKSKKFYAHDEKNTAHVGDFVEIEETRPMSKLKRWRLTNVIQKAKLVGGEEAQAASN
jgi:small subunit ribosomal protein S17